MKNKNALNYLKAQFYDLTNTDITFTIEVFDRLSAMWLGYSHGANLSKKDYLIGKEMIIEQYDKMSKKP